MNPETKKKIWTVVLILVAVVALLNQRLTMTDPENTYPKRIKRSLRLLFNPAENELDRHLIGKGIECDEPRALYQKAAAATVVIQTGQGVGAGVFIGPELIATAKHVVDGGQVQVRVPDVLDEDLARPGRNIPIQQVIPVKSLDLAFIQTRARYPYWLVLDPDVQDDRDLMVVGHPNRKYYSLQKARIKKKSAAEKSPFLFFKDNEIFFGNSGGTIINCKGQLMGVVSMMSNFDNAMRKQGIGINARTVQKIAGDLHLMPNPPIRRGPEPQLG